MADLLEKYNELKRAKNEKLDLSELKDAIGQLPRFDQDTIMSTVGAGMVKFFTENVEQADKRKEETIQAITDQLGKLIVNAAKINKQNINDSSKNLTESVEKAVESLNEAISNIPQADLSGLDASIKGIKPTDVSNIEIQIVNLINELKKLSNKKQPKQKDIDLTPIIEELSKPVNVDFSIEYDQWDYPVKIKAKEIK